MQRRNQQQPQVIIVKQRRGCLGNAALLAIVGFFTGGLGLLAVGFGWLITVGWRGTLALMRWTWDATVQIAKWSWTSSVWLVGVTVARCISSTPTGQHALA